MPADRSLADDLNHTLLDLYADLEQRLLAELARRLRTGADSPRWAEQKLAAIGSLQRWTRTLLQRTAAQTGDAVDQALLLAHVRGGEAALDELAELQLDRLDRLALSRRRTLLATLVRLLRGRGARRRRAALDAELYEIRRQLPGADAIQTLAFTLVAKLSGTHLPILRWTVDSYRNVVARATTAALAGISTRVEAAQTALAELAARGVTGFVDRRDRRWSLTSYVEMATRSSLAQAAIQSHLDQLAAAGIDLVQVSDAPGECARCRPWESTVLRRTGPPGPATVQVEHAIHDGEMVTVHIAGSVAEAIAAGLMHPNCFPGEVLVSAPSGVVAADARRYQGPLVVVHTAGGNRLRVTPNHPVLTPEGWVPAGQLHIGQNVLRHALQVKQSTLGTPHDHEIPTRIGEVFDALRQSSAMTSVRVPIAAEQFHGDGLGSDVNVVLTDGLLRNGARQEGGQGQLVGSRMGTGSLLADRAALKFFHAPGGPAYRRVCGGDLSSSLRCVHRRPLSAFGLASISAIATLQQGVADGGLGPLDLFRDSTLRYPVEVQSDGDFDPGPVPLLWDTGETQPPEQRIGADIHGGRYLAEALAGQVTLSRVVQVEVRREWSGHVYNLQTNSGWYVAGGIVVHNCRHRFSAFLPGLTRTPTGTADPAGDAARRRQRALERQIRVAKREVAVAPDSGPGRRARIRLRDLQVQLRGHLQATGLRRKPGRERAGGVR